MKIKGASSFPKIFCCTEGRRGLGFWGGLGVFLGRGGCWVFCKGMRVMKPLQGLLYFQKKLIRLLTIHTVAQQKFSALGLPY